MTGNILIADDEANARMAMDRQLREDFGITAAAGGGEALELLETNGPFALIVSDMRMPGMNGVQLLGEFVKHAPDTVRIMLTGCTDQQTAIDAVNEGSIFRLLTKPCPPETLVAAIRAGLGQYLRQREHNNLSNTLPDALYVFDMNMKLVKWNKVMEERAKITKYGKEGRRITVSAVYDPSADEVRIVVRDNGGGVPEDVLGRVFDPFFTTKEVGRGMGMGLSTCYGAVTALGGFIEANNVDGGAQFAIAFPLAPFPSQPPMNSRTDE